MPTMSKINSTLTLLRNKRKLDYDCRVEVPEKARKNSVLSWTQPRKIHQSSKVLRKYFSSIKLMMKSANGTLYAAKEINSGRPVCLKQFEKSRTTCMEYYNKTQIPAEIFFHFKAYEAAPGHIVQPIDWLEFKDYYVLVMERPIKFVDLFEAVKQYPHGMAENKALFIHNQLVNAAKALQSAGICHRDIKDENVLIDPSTLKIKIIDFGSATWIEEKYTRPRGTPEYWPPEYFLEDEYRPEELTVWSLGCILYILLTGEWKFKKPIVQRNYSKEKLFSLDTYNLVQGILCANPKQRFKLGDL